jgi:predicted amidohydrolase YtcJ
MIDLIFYNAKIYMQNACLKPATAVAIRGNQIAAVGNDLEMFSLADSHTRKIDMAGRLVLPGFVDSHFHLHEWALGRKRLVLSAAESLAELRQLLANRALEKPAGEWIVGQGWNETRWPEPRLLTCDDLDDLTPNHPTILWRSDGHLAVANSLALQAANINSEMLDPPEGVIDRTISGKPTGVLRDLAIELVRAVIPPPSEAETVIALHEGIAELHKQGLTGVHDARMMAGSEGKATFHAYQRLKQTSGLGIRVWMMIPGQYLTEAIDLGLQCGFGDDYLRIGHAKFFADGGQGARTAWMLEDYEDTPTQGMPLTPMNEIAEAADHAQKAGFALAIHSIGDRANKELVNVFEHLLGNPQGPSEFPARIPHRIEHVQNMRPDDVRRLGRLGVVASVQPIHVTDDYPMIDRSVGKRGCWAYPFRDFLKAGVPMAFGSDCPVASSNPIFGIHAAVTRRMRSGLPEGGWYPDQCLTVAEAVWAYTMGSAHACGREKELGSIAPGKFADLVALDRDIFSIEPMEIASSRVVMTIFDGQIVFEE